MQVIGHACRGEDSATFNAKFEELRALLTRALPLFQLFDDPRIRQISSMIGWDFNSLHAFGKFLHERMKASFEQLASLIYAVEHLENIARDARMPSEWMPRSPDSDLFRQHWKAFNQAWLTVQSNDEHQRDGFKANTPSFSIFGTSSYTPNASSSSYTPKSGTASNAFNASGSSYAPNASSSPGQDTDMSDVPILGPSKPAAPLQPITRSAPTTWASSNAPQQPASGALVNSQPNPHAQDADMSDAIAIAPPDPAVPMPLSTRIAPATSCNNRLQQPSSGAVFNNQPTSPAVAQPTPSAHLASGPVTILHPPAPASNAVPTTKATPSGSLSKSTDLSASVHAGNTTPSTPRPVAATPSNASQALMIFNAPFDDAGSLLMTLGDSLFLSPLKLDVYNITGRLKGKRPFDINRFSLLKASTKAVSSGMRRRFKRTTILLAKEWHQHMKALRKTVQTCPQQQVLADMQSFTDMLFAVLTWLDGPQVSGPPVSTSPPAAPPSNGSGNGDQGGFGASQGSSSSPAANFGAFQAPPAPLHRSSGSSPAAGGASHSCSASSLKSTLAPHPASSGPSNPAGGALDSSGASSSECLFAKMPSSSGSAPHVGGTSNHPPPSSLQLFTGQFTGMSILICNLSLSSFKKQFQAEQNVLDGMLHSGTIIDDNDMPLLLASASAVSDALDQDWCKGEPIENTFWYERVGAFLRLLRGDKQRVKDSLHTSPDLQAVKDQLEWVVQHVYKKLKAEGVVRNFPSLAPPSSGNGDGGSSGGQGGSGGIAGPPSGSSGPPPSDHGTSGSSSAPSTMRSRLKLLSSDSLRLFASECTSMDQLTTLLANPVFKKEVDGEQCRLDKLLTARVVVDESHVPLYNASIRAVFFAHEEEWFEPAALKQKAGIWIRQIKKFWEDADLFASCAQEYYAKAGCLQNLKAKIEDINDAMDVAGYGFLVNILASSALPSSLAPPTPSSSTAFPLGLSPAAVNAFNSLSPPGTSQPTPAPNSTFTLQNKGKQRAVTDTSASNPSSSADNVQPTPRTSRGNLKKKQLSAIPEDATVSSGSGSGSFGSTPGNMVSGPISSAGGAGFRTGDAFAASIKRHREDYE